MALYAHRWDADYDPNMNTTSCVLFVVWHQN